MCVCRVAWENEKGAETKLPCFSLGKKARRLSEPNARGRTSSIFREIYVSRASWRRGKKTKPSLFLARILSDRCVDFDVVYVG